MKNLTFSMICATILLGADVANEITYLSNTKKSYELIKLPQAMSENPNINGNGVNIGIVDTNFNKFHQSLTGKFLSIDGTPYDDSVGDKNWWAGYPHGTHIASIIVGNDLGDDKPKGVAYGAKFYGVQSKNGYYSPNIDLKEYFKDRPEVKIINNSRAVNIRLDQNFDFFSPKSIEDAIKAIDLGDVYKNDNDENDLRNLVWLSKNKEILNIFGAGNRGLNHPEISALLPYFDHELLSYIAVGALNTEHITFNNGKAIIAENGILDVTNTLKNAKNFSLMAPGGKILGANGFFDKKDIFAPFTPKNCDSLSGEAKTKCIGDDSEAKRNYDEVMKDRTALFKADDGTSQATAIVSGVAALVQQKFPFLSGKQIADVLLSTASKDYELPKFIVRPYGHGEKRIAYIGVSAVPSDEVIKSDLQQVGFNQEDIAEILKAQKSILTPDEVMGQGIIDAKKALNGLGVLDANRILPRDNRAVYEINTNGFDATFSNDISQKKWDDTLHSPQVNEKYGKILRDLDVEFVKTGDGKLTLSGKNSYKGKTYVNGGELILTGSLEGDVIVSNAKFSGNGTINASLTNSGFVESLNTDTLTINGYYRQTNDGNLILNFNTKGNSKLNAQSYQIEGGKLLYKPLLGEFYAANEKVVIDLGELKSHLNNFSSVEILSNGAVDFDIKNFIIAQDKTTINDQTQPPLTPPEKPVEKPVEKPTTPEKPTEKPTNPNIPNDKITAEIKIKKDAYEVANSNIGNAIYKARISPNLNDNYKEIFKILDLKTTNSEQILNSIADDKSQDATQNQITQTRINAQNNMFFSLNPQNFTNILTANSLNEPIKIASISDDVMSFKILNDSIEPSKNHAFYLTPNYKKIRGDNGENGRAYGFDLGFATAIDDRQNLAFNLSYQKAKNKYDLAEFNSNYVNFGLNHALDVGAFKILSGVSVGGGKNDFEREILGVSNLNGSYKNLFLTATLGVSKAFEFGDFSVSPLGYFGYNFIRQNAFSENGALFAKEFEAINHHSTLLGAGVSLNHTKELENKILQLGGFAVFERRLSGNKYDTKVRFKDFDDSYFTQKYELNKNLLTLGLNSHIDFKNGAFFRLNLANEIAKSQKSVSVFATLGYKF